MWTVFCVRLYRFWSRGYAGKRASFGDDDDGESDGISYPISFRCNSKWEAFDCDLIYEALGKLILADDGFLGNHMGQSNGRIAFPAIVGP